MHVQGDNLAEMWIKFLINETEQTQSTAGAAAAGGATQRLKMPSISSDDFDDRDSRGITRQLSPMIGQEQQGLRSSSVVTVDSEEEETA